jgi:hypothetical protein
MLHIMETETLKNTSNLVNQTTKQFDEVMTSCRDIFVKKTKDYGTSWRVMRPKSLTDQIFIKAKRIQTIDNKGKNLVQDSIDDDYKGIINYCILALIQIALKDDLEVELSPTRATNLFDGKVQEIKDLMLMKNHDYGEAWRDMRVSSFTDLVLMRLMRLKQIEDNNGSTLISEGPESNYMDIVNYCVFALIKLGEN